ncbi:MAG TPA: hypothetical protein VJN43_22950 [Bryobacteraceae bacterium]|nr:hypothetical protein [Bryobacteraceae bacterium]
MKRDASFFEEGRAELVYIAKRLKDALRLESILTDAGIDYGVEADRYSGGLIFRSERVGAFFYVLPESLEATHQIMRQKGYRPYEEH